MAFPANSVMYSALSGPSATLARRLPATGGENQDKPPVDVSRARRSLAASTNQTADSPRFGAMLTGRPMSTSIVDTMPEARSIHPMREHPSAAHQMFPSVAAVRAVGMQPVGRTYSAMTDPSIT